VLSAVVLRTQPDSTLVALAAEGSEAAFETIVQRYRRPLDSYCRRLLLSESRSEDVVQQVFLNAWTALRAGVEIRALRAWLYRITHNEALGAMRRPGYDFEELSEALHGTGASQGDLERRALMRETLAALAALPDMQREAILRTAVDGHSYEEVAAALGVSDTAVRGLVYRARSSLRLGLAAVAPPPLVLWAAGASRRGTGVSQWVAEAVAGGGSAGGAAVVIKSAAVLATTAAVVGGAVGAPFQTRRAPAPPPRRAVAARRPGPRRAVEVARVSATRTTPSAAAPSHAPSTRSQALAAARAHADGRSVSAAQRPVPVRDHRARRARPPTAGVGAAQPAAPAASVDPARPQASSPARSPGPSVPQGQPGEAPAQNEPGGAIGAMGVTGGASASPPGPFMPTP
jgi:RNA polymerase sigma factor (sigma-70 family)